MLATKLLSAVIGLVLCLPASLVVAYGLAYAYCKLTGVKAFEGVFGMAVVQLTLVIGPILALACGVAHFLTTSRSLPTRLLLIDAGLLVISALLIWRFVK